MLVPDLKNFVSLSSRGNLVPVYREILADTDTPVSAAMKLGGSPSFLLESVEELPAPIVEHRQKIDPPERHRDDRERHAAPAEAIDYAGAGVNRIRSEGREGGRPDVDGREGPADRRHAWRAALCRRCGRQ